MGLHMAAGVYVAPVDDGVVWLGGRGPTRMRGTSIAALVERLAPHLDGGSSIEQFVDGLGEAQAQAVRRLVRLMIDRGLVVDPDTGSRPVKPWREVRVVIVADGEWASWCREAVEHSRAAEVASASGADADAICGADAVIHLFSGAGTGRADALHKACSQSGSVLTQAMVGRDAALQVRGVSWDTVRRRLRPALRGRFSGLDMSPSAGRVLTAQLVRATMNRWEAGPEGVTPGAAGAATWFDAGTLRTSVHSVLVHPGSSQRVPETSVEFGRSVEALRTAGPISPQEFSQRVVDAIDPRFGLIARIDEDGLGQVPLRQSRSVVGDPTRDRPVEVSAHGPDLLSTRGEVALQGLATHALGAVDPRRLTAGRIWGLALPSGPSCLVTVGPDAVVVAGLSWDDLVARAVLAYVRRDALTHLDANDLHRLDIDRVGLPPDSVRLRRLVTAGGHRVEIFNVPAAAPTVATSLDGHVVHVSSALRLVEAIAEGLREALSWAQSRRLDGIGTAMTWTETPHEEVRDVSCHEVIQALGRAGGTPVLVPLADTDVARATPFVAALVVADV